MVFEKLCDEQIQSFIRSHVRDDVRDLALRKPPVADWPYAEILQQIRALQKSERKIPDWYSTMGVIMPHSDVIEQASSQATSLYKKFIIQPAQVFVDLTAGVGVDSWALLQMHDRGVCVEKDAKTAACLRYNMQKLGDRPLSVLHMAAEDYIQTMDSVDLVFLDPGRREGGRKGKNFLADGAPNILELLPVLRDKAHKILLKTSPMLDMSCAIQDLENKGGFVEEIHVLEWCGECKEVLYLIGFDSVPNIPVYACILNDNGTVRSRHHFIWQDEPDTPVQFSEPGKYIYEPAACVMKSGGFKSLAQGFQLRKLHMHTHLYTSDCLIDAFPGRCFRFIDTYPVQAKSLPLKKANLSVRNFPSRVDTLRKKLKLKDGGEDYLFACTLLDESKVLLHVRKD